MVGARMEFLDEELDKLRKKGLHRKLRILEGKQEPVAIVDGRRVVNLSSNNYLGLNAHPRLIAAAHAAVDRYGVGSGSARTIIGTQTIHEELEEKLAEFKEVGATLVLQSGFAANVGVIQALLEEGDAIFSDELNHASVIDGIRMTKAKRYVYPHKDMNGLRKVLGEGQGARRKLVVTDGVFSMDGDIAPLPQIVELAEEYGAMVMVDDAHGTGVLGTDGKGIVDHFALHGRVQIQVGTLSKALGAFGGFVAGSTALREFLIHKARPFLFSTSHPASIAATCVAAIDLLLEGPELIAKLWENTRYFKSSLAAMGFDTAGSETPITPVIAGSAFKAFAMSDRLFDLGVLAQGIGYPTVPEARSRVRTIVTATHTKENLDFALDAFERIGKEIGII